MRSVLQHVLLFAVVWGLQGRDIGRAEAKSRQWPEQEWDRGTWAMGAKVDCKGIETRPHWKKKGHTCSPTTSGEIRVKVRRRPHGLCVGARNNAFSNLGVASKCIIDKYNCTCELIGEERDDKSKKGNKGEEDKQTKEAVRYRDKHPQGKGDVAAMSDEYAPDWADREDEYRKNWEGKQGFPGVFDPTNGNLKIRPSPPHGETEKLKDAFAVENLRKEFWFTPPKDKSERPSAKAIREVNKTMHYWVTRNGGHGELAGSLDDDYLERFESLHEQAKKLVKDNDEAAYKELSKPENRTKLLRGFTLIRANKKKNGKWVYTIKWKSGTINGDYCKSLQDPNNTICKTDDLPEKLRQDVLDAIAYHAPDIYENLENK